MIVQLPESLYPEMTMSEAGNGVGTDYWNSDVRENEIPTHLRSRVALQRSPRTATQTVQGAAVYILHLPRPSLGLASGSLGPYVITCLQAHLDVLQLNPTSRMLLLIRPFPGDETCPGVTAQTRLRDLSHWQLTNNYDLDVQDVVRLLPSACNGLGRLVLVNKVRDGHRTIVALEIRFKAYGDLEYL